MMGPRGIYNVYVIPLLARLAVLAGRLLSVRFLLALREGIDVSAPLDYGPTRILLRCDGWIEYAGRRSACQKEPETLEWIKQWVGPGHVLYDVGANVGAYSLIAHAHTRGQATIYAFEPGVPTFGQLCKNIRLNGAGAEVIPLCVALSNRTGLTAFHYSNLRTGAAGHALGVPTDSLGRPFTPVYSQPVLSYRLDDLIAAFDLLQPNHIKIDVDGTEVQVLEGATSTLREPCLRTIMVECEPQTEAKVRDLLCRHGFQAMIFPGRPNILFTKA